jgi:hypothetical protein
MILFIDVVASMEPHQPCWIDAAHRSSGNDPGPRQVLSGVRHAAHILTSGIKRVRVDVESTVASVREDEIALPRVGLGLFMKSARRHQMTQQRHMRVRYRNVQIVVASSLLSQQSVYSPTAVDVDLKPALFEELEQLDDAWCVHWNPSLVRVIPRYLAMGLISGLLGRL